MHKDQYMAVLRTINEIEDLFIKADALYEAVPEIIRQKIHDYHNPRATLQYCLRWGLQAASDIREDWHVVVSKLEVTAE